MIGRPVVPAWSLVMVARHTRYSAVAILLHWLIAALILLNIWFGWRMGQVKGLAQFELFQLHKSIGILVLLLSVARLGWRLLNPPPTYPASMTRWERRTAATAHWALYGFMILLPLTGWVIVSASLYNLPTLLFKTVPWPHIGFVHTLPTATRKAIEDQVGEIHEWLAWTLLALVVFHVAAALKHHLWDRDDVVVRMLPLLRRRSSAIASES
jgi:cytochrome b561